MGNTAANVRQRRPIPGARSAAAPRPTDLLASFFAAAFVMFAAAAIALVLDATDDGTDWHWLALHLALLGGVSQLVLGAAQFFVCAFLATTPPSRRETLTQLGCWNAGTILAATGVLTDAVVLTSIGAVLLGAGLASFAAALRAMQHRSLQRARWAVRWYQYCAVCLAGGLAIGLALAHHVTWTHGSLLGAHLALNIAGWLGMAIVGTLHTFFPSLTGTQLRIERLQGPTLWLWLAGVVALAVGAAFAIDPLTAAGWLGLLAGAALLAINLVASLRARTITLSLPARLVGSAQPFLVAGLALALVTTLSDGADGPLSGATRGALAVLLLAGWVGLTVAGSLLHLLGMLARARNLFVNLPAARPREDTAIVVLAGSSIALWALVQLDALSSLHPLALALRLLAAAALLSQLMPAVRRAITAAPSRRPAGTPTPP